MTRDHMVVVIDGWALEHNDPRVHNTGEKAGLIGTSGCVCRDSANTLSRSTTDLDTKRSLKL